MHTETEWKIRGVAALIVNPARNSFLTVEERETKRSTNKIAGMRTIPMETVNLGEDLESAFERLFHEEFQLINFDTRNATRRRLGVFELTLQATVYLDFFELGEEVTVILGSESHEVTNPAWIEFHEVMIEPIGSNRFRPGTRDGAETYIAYRTNPSRFIPRFCRSDELKDKIRPEIFEMAEMDGTTSKEVLSRLGLHSVSPSSIPILAHSS